MSLGKAKWAGAALVATALVIGFAFRGDPVSAPPTPQPVLKSVAAPTEAMARMEVQAAKTARERLARIPEPVVPQTVGGFAPEEIAKVSGVYREMLAVQGLYNQRLSRERLVARVLETSQGVDIAARTLTDPSFAREAFGESQAEARFFSIDVLKAAARKGDAAPLERSTEAVAQQLSQSDDGTTPLDAGRSADLRDMVRAYIEVKGVEAFSDGNSRLVSAMGYSPTSSPRVKSLYDEVLFIRLRQQFGRERAASMTAALLDR
ncbi:hypothetical protein [Melittangium boletus]|uniref:Uncharacterized protein n=1 Tax=Melittangium boletus DSM 14713 TaxID=1294270 RepID=A0A250IP84_9BACT|nr:hypothetical protein [Melittangium boletus]ATB32977.1 hypothetical protein MEBOL_006466 [Melittangium boletus DSM 14713]